MYVGVSQSLPKTNGIKMIDYWLIFNLLVPFMEVIIHIKKDMKDHQEDEQEDTSRVQPLVLITYHFTISLFFDLFYRL